MFFVLLSLDKVILQESYKEKASVQTGYNKTNLSQVFFVATKEDIYSLRLKCSGSIKIISPLCFGDLLPLR